MVTESNMNAEELKRSLLQENDINIFDVFAIIYLYCEPRFNTIRPKLAGTDTVSHVRRVVSFLGTFLGGIADSV